MQVFSPEIVAAAAAGMVGAVGIGVRLLLRARAEAAALARLDAGRGSEVAEGSGQCAHPVPAAPAATPDVCRTVRVYFVKPSKYDDEGRVQCFWKGVLPSNTLGVLAGLNEQYNRRRRDRGDVYLETVLWDEHVDGIITAATIAAIKDKAKEDGVEVIVGLAGVQTNQYPRARDIALQFRAAGFTVLFGGFHVSGYPPSRRFLEECGVTTVVGEAEGIWDRLIEDYLAGRLARSYSVNEGMRAKTGHGEIMVPVIAHAQLPLIDRRYLRRFTSPGMTTLDTSRGCPFTCSYCSVKNVMGRTMRARDPEAVVAWVRDAIDRHGIDCLFLVDDNFYRNPAWEPILEGLAALRRSGRRLAFMMQVDAEPAAFGPLAPGEEPTSQRRRGERFLEAAARAGCYQAFIGFETFNPANLLAAAKVQNLEKGQRRSAAGEEAAERVAAKYRRVVENWHRVGVAVHAGYMIGFPLDGPGCGREAARRLIDVGVDLASFFIVTPLPGTEDHERAVRDGTITDWDFNNYDSQHMVSAHPLMTREQVVEEYREAHRVFYSPRRLLRCLATYHGGRGLSYVARQTMVRQFVYYSLSYLRRRHPMLGGIWRRRLEAGRRQAVTDEEARAIYLGGGLVSPEGVSITVPA